MYLLIFGQLLVGSYPADFRNLLGHRCTKPHHHDKVADHSGGYIIQIYLVWLTVVIMLWLSW